MARQGPWRTSRPLKRSPWVLEAIEDRDVAEVRASLERIIPLAGIAADDQSQARLRPSYLANIEHWDAMEGSP